MASFSIDVLPNPAPDHDSLLQYSSRLKALRLRGLKNDTKSFISKYESEVKEPEEFWLNRLKDDHAIHLVLTRDNTTILDTTLLQKEWVGFVVIIAPDGPSSAEWYMVALYIEPEVRGQGLGKRLVQTTIDYVKNNSRKEEAESTCCLTTVLHGNDNALELYQRLGFEIIDPNEHIEKEGRKYLATKLRVCI